MRAQLRQEKENLLRALLLVCQSSDSSSAVALPSTPNTQPPRVETPSSQTVSLTDASRTNPRACFANQRIDSSDPLESESEPGLVPSQAEALWTAAKEAREVGCSGALIEEACAHAAAKLQSELSVAVDATRIEHPDYVSGHRLQVLANHPLPAA